MASELFERYKKDIEKDLDINRMNLGDKVFNVPAIKHFWVAKLIEAKRNLRELNVLKKKTLNDLSNDDKVIALKLSSAKNVLNNLPSIQEINNQIEETEEIIEYLTYAEKIFNYLGNDIKNIIDLLKMENL